ncbi:hypothetical protein P152DRAFT_278 [Eremomyces bilateralis CBS 781.70]|uniref:Uncharacterized protein n=1 Tax=Eremomyces bilateralis CBS 781.70 TaxID=1392243 RepID=A0A6G1GFU0_9PEZI|nr:uncharacterized protein P152DRAFT_278 [Eremomyces bilateralis CBS 781.70]KAF1816781.1 hypothetical protein P152DRAFT_278 [Eremomyces bilateralis CBS 781.70]
MHGFQHDHGHQNERMSGGVISGLLTLSMDDLECSTRIEASNRVRIYYMCYNNSIAISECLVGKVTESSMGPVARNRDINSLQGSRRGARSLQTDRVKVSHVVIWKSFLVQSRAELYPFTYRSGTVGDVGNGRTLNQDQSKCSNGTPYLEQFSDRQARNWLNDQ